MSLLKVIGAVLSPITGLFKSWNDGRVRIKEAKINAQVARYTAEAKFAEKRAEIEADWDLEALRAARDSWKDEWLVVLLSMPFLGSFIPVVQDYVVLGWEYVGKAPAWYQISFLGIVAASFGLRWWFTQQKINIMRSE